MKKNKRNEEVSVPEMLRYLKWHLQERGGVTTRKELEEGIVKTYGNIFGPSDKELITAGCGQTEKWKHSVLGAISGNKATPN